MIFSRLTVLQWSLMPCWEILKRQRQAGRSSDNWTRRNAFPKRAIASHSGAKPTMRNSFKFIVLWECPNDERAKSSPLILTFEENEAECLRKKCGDDNGSHENVARRL